MCCFAGHVTDVAATNIFARIDADREYLVYEMTFTSDDQTAMILPIPIASDAAEDAVTFVALDDYGEFFRDLETHFADLRSRAQLLGGMGLRLSLSLKVQLVGAFEASFVPNVDHLDRLDARFRIPRQTWKQLPTYESFGFVVFRLRPGKRVHVHPMAFSFPTRDPETLFFPTLHIHDGTFHEKADFDHVFYTQNEPRSSPSWPGAFWMPSDQPAREYLRVSRARGLVATDAPCFQTSLARTWMNADVLVPI
jgi:hypothetical protein